MLHIRELPLIGWESFDSLAAYCGTEMDFRELYYYMMGVHFLNV